ncbi:ABC transporter permease [Alteromonas flava]|uniref:ABC transporter permease n=1 Tax=Alteromonas flava TaxID=2048003 RepID=UPI000C2885FD|nr:FtsX-like permease family protein [Alteromonas flava]
MLNSNIRLAWQLHQLEKGAPYNRTLVWVQAILLTFIITLSLSSESIQRYLANNLQNLLGADVVIAQSAPLTSPQAEQLAAFAEHSIYTQSVQTTLTRGEDWQRVTLKAVGDDYPLQGELRVADLAGGPSLVANTGPGVGEIWPDERLMAALSLKVGDTITITQYPLKVTKRLQHEPDRLMEGYNLSMRALIHRDSLAQFSFNSRDIDYRYMATVNDAKLQSILDWQKIELPAAQVHHKRGEHPLALFWQRTENFIGLASIILFFMAAIAIQQITQVKTQHEQFFTAVCLSLGSTRRQAVTLAILKWLLSLAALLPLVVLASLVCHWLVVQWLSATLMQLTWHLNPLDLVKPLVAGSMLFITFQFPVWLALQQASVRQLVYRQHSSGRALFSLLCAVFVLVAIGIAYSDNGLLTAMVLGAMVSCILLILLISWFGLTLGEKLTQRYSGLIPFTLFMMKQRLLSKTTQVLGVGLCAFLLLFTLMLLRDLGATMQGYQRTHDGNLLVTQATAQQLDDLQSWSNGRNVQFRQQKPFVYAKLSAINHKPVAEFSTQPSGSLATLQREIRLHWTDAVPRNNRVFSGQWWESGTSDWQQVSVEEEVMTDLGLSLGDQLTFYIANQPITFRITASHAYKPGAGSITFWVQMPAMAINYLAAQRYAMASLEVSNRDFTEISQLWQLHPTLRMVSMQEMMQRFDRTLAMVTQVIGGFAILICVLAIIVILASVQALESQERLKNSVILSFGLSKKTCWYMNGVEWLVTAVIAAGGAIFGTWVAGVMIYQSQFSLPYHPDITWLALTLSVILIIVMCVGGIASRNSLRSSVRELMAE